VAAAIVVRYIYRLAHTAEHGIADEDAARRKIFRRRSFF